MAWFQVSFFSECYSRPVQLNVLLPADNFGPGLPPAGKEQFRTLYLLHGYAGNGADWLLNGQLAELSQQYNLAIVMPSGYNGFYVDQPKSGILGSSFIGKELVTFTRQLFPLSHKREDTILGGLSMGGFGALYNALKHSEVVGHAISLSAPVNFTRFADPSSEPAEMGLHKGYFEALFGDLSKLGETDVNLARLALKLVNSDRQQPELYIACGYNDMLVGDNRELVATLKRMRYPLFYEEGPGTHEWPFWNTYLSRGLAHVFPEGPTVAPNPFWVEKTVARGGF